MNIQDTENTNKIIMDFPCIPCIPWLGIKEKMSKRNENRPGYKNTKVGWIPKEWKCVRLDAVACVKTGPFGAQLHENDYVEEGTPIITVEHLNELGVVHNNLPLVSDSDKERLSQYLIEEGDIVFSRVGSVDRNSLISKDEHGWLFSGRLLRVRSNRQKVFPQFLSAYLHREPTKHYIRSIAVGGTMSCLNTQLLSGVPIPLPPLPEQKKIAEILSAWNRTIEQVGKLIDTKQRLKKGLMQQLLTGRMRFPEFGKPVREKAGLLEGWKMIRAKKMFERRSVKNCGKETVLSVTQDVGVVPRDSLDRKINMTDSNTDTYKLVEPGDFVISLRSFQGGIEYSKHRGIVSPAYHVIRPTVKVDNDFYRHYFKSYEFVGHLAIAVIGIRDGKQISYDDFAYMRFPYPPVPEQIRIATVLSTCDREIELLKKKQGKLKEQKKGLMQKLLTGEVRVKM